MSTDDLRERAAKQLLGGRERIRAKAHGLTPIQAARRQYGDDAIDAVEAALDDPRVDLTDGLLAAVRDDATLDDATAAATDADATDDSDGDSDGFDATVMSAGDYVDQRQKRRERVEADRTPASTDDADAGPDDVALAAMDGDDRVEANARDQSPAEYIQAEYGLMAAEYDDADALHAAIIEQTTDQDSDQPEP